MPSSLLELLIYCEEIFLLNLVSIGADGFWTSGSDLTRTYILDQEQDPGDPIDSGSASDNTTRI